jgi:hypothetical protein
MSFARPIVCLIALGSLALQLPAQNRPMDLQWLRNAGARLDGGAVAEHVGHAVAGAGDVNGDGVADFLVGATQSTGDFLNDPPGRAYLFFGAPGETADGVASSLAGVSFVGDDNTGNFSGTQAGFRVAGAGDVNLDGFADVLIGAPRAEANGNSSAGRVYLVYGAASMPATIQLATLAPPVGVVINGAGSGDLLGTSVAGLGDADGDGTPDLLLGASGEGGPTLTARGSAYVLFGNGALPGLLEIEAPVGASVSRFIGTENSEDAGESVAAAGDVNADGLQDAVIGAERVGTGSNTNGAAYIVLGNAALPASTNLNALGALGTVVSGQTSGDLLGHDVAGGGDVNGDGFADVLLGARNATPPQQKGKAYLLFGKASMPTAVAAASIGGVNSGVIFNGLDDNDSAGSAVAAGGDVDGDGYDDLLISASGGDPNSLSSAGETYLVYGGTWLTSGSVALGALGQHGVVLNGVAASDGSGSATPHGHALALAGDVDGDGFADLLVGAELADPAGASSGSAWLVKGAPHMIQAVGPVLDGGTLTLRIHGAPSLGSVTFASIGALATPISTKFGPWWFNPAFPLFTVFTLPMGANGELFLPGLPMPSGLLGITITMQTLGTPQGKHLDLTYLLKFTIE